MWSWALSRVSLWRSELGSWRKYHLRCAAFNQVTSSRESADSKHWRNSTRVWRPVRTDGEPTTPAQGDRSRVYPSPRVHICMVQCTRSWNVNAKHTPAVPLLRK